MTEVTRLWSVWQGLLSPFAWAFTKAGYRRFAEWITALALNVEEHTITQSVLAVERTDDWKALESFAEYGAWRGGPITTGFPEKLHSSPGSVRSVLIASAPSNERRGPAIESFPWNDDNRSYMTTSLMAPSHHGGLISHGLRQKLLDLPPVSPEQPLHIQHARPVLLPVPGRSEPPVHRAGRLQSKLCQPQQTHRHPLRLARPLDRVPRPRPAFLPAQTLLQIPKPVLLPEPRGEQFHHLEARQLHRRTDQREPLLVALHLGDHRLDRHVVSRDVPATHDLLPADLPPATVEEGFPLAPVLLPVAPLARRWQPPTPFLVRPMPLGQRGVQPGIMPQPREELDAGRPVLGCDQRPDHTLQREAPVDDAQVPDLEDPGLLPEQLDHQLALGVEHLLGAGEARPGGQLRLAEVEPPGQRQEPGGLAGVLEQRPDDDPVVRPHGGGPVRAAGGVLVEGAGAPDVVSRAVDLGVIARRDVVAVPEPPRGRVGEPGQASGYGSAAPGAVLGEGLQGLPVVGAFDGQDRLGDRVLLDVQGQGGDPLGKAPTSRLGEGPGEGVEQVLPDRPELRNFGHRGISVRTRMGYHNPSRFARTMPCLIVDARPDRV